MLFGCAHPGLKALARSRSSRFRLPSWFWIFSCRGLHKFCFIHSRIILQQHSCPITASLLKTTSCFTSCCAEPGPNLAQEVDRAAVLQVLMQIIPAARVILAASHILHADSVRFTTRPTFSASRPRGPDPKCSLPPHEPHERTPRVETHTHTHTQPVRQTP